MKTVQRISRPSLSEVDKPLLSQTTANNIHHSSPERPSRDTSSPQTWVWCCVSQCCCSAFLSGRCLFSILRLRRRPRPLWKPRGKSWGFTEELVSSASFALQTFVFRRGFHFGLYESRSTVSPGQRSVDLIVWDSLTWLCWTDRKRISGC